MDESLALMFVGAICALMGIVIFTALSSICFYAGLM